jgi:hypothetical protein
MEAYKIGITIALSNQVSNGLLAITRDFAKTQAHAVALQKTLKEINLLGVSGTIFTGAGFMGLKAIESAVKPATEYAHQLSLMNAAGMTQKEIAEATAAAWATTGTVMSSNVSENLKTIGELRMVFGNNADAIGYLPTMMKGQAVINNVLGEKGGSAGRDAVVEAAKALEVRGASRTKENFVQEYNMIIQGVIASGGKVTPHEIRMAVQQAKMSGTSFGRDYLYTILPTLMQEMSGASVGSGSNAMYRALVGGSMDKKSLALWEKLGLANTSGAKVAGEAALLGRAAMSGSDLFEENPLRYVEEVLAPALEKHGVTDQKDINATLSALFSNPNAAGMVNLLATQAPRLHKNAGLINAAGISGSYADMLKKDPSEAQKAMGKQWENLKVAIGLELIPIIIPALQMLTYAIHGMMGWAREHPALVKAIMVTAGAISVLAIMGGILMLFAAGIKALAFVGPALSAIGLVARLTGGVFMVAARVAMAAGALIAPAFAALGLSLGTVALIAIGVVAVVLGAIYVVKHWDGIKQKLMQAWADVADFFTRLGDVIGKSLTALWARIKNFMPSWLGGDPAQPGYTPTNGSSSITYQISVNMDGKQVGEGAVSHMLDKMARPKGGNSGTDANFFMMQPALL